MAYKDHYGDLRIPSKFIVPDDDSWPRVTRSLRLGDTLLTLKSTHTYIGTKTSAIRSMGRFVKNMPERRAALDALGG